ncbi:MAG TPA: hypothetical protein VN903_01175 [Polyangia bacterium]|jgi:hypothetical protein|nr:hypothetical protein [Polyangia bacterium]
MFRTVRFAYAGDLEWTFDENGDPVLPGGKALTLDIATALASAAGPVPDVDQHSYYGWAFAWRSGNGSFFHVLNAGDDEVYLTVDMWAAFLKRLLLQRPAAAFDRHCARLETVLAAIPGVSNVRWETGRG